MFRDDSQASRAIGALLHAIPGTRGMWTATGPTQVAVGLMHKDGGALASGERILLLAAFALWNGEGRLPLVDVIQRLELRPAEALCSLILAVKQGAQAVDAWIAVQPVTLMPVR